MSYCSKIETSTYLIFQIKAKLKACLIQTTFKSQGIMAKTNTAISQGIHTAISQGIIAKTNTAITNNEHFYGPLEFILTRLHCATFGVKLLLI